MKVSLKNCRIMRENPNHNKPEPAVNGVYCRPATAAHDGPCF